MFEITQIFFYPQVRQSIYNQKKAYFNIGKGEKSPWVATWIVS